MIVVGACFTGNIFGDGGLDAGSSEGKGKCQYRCDQLVNTHSLGAEGVREEDTVEETDKAAEQSGQCQDDSAGDKRIFPVPFHNTPSLRSDMI